MNPPRPPQPPAPPEAADAPGAPQHDARTQLDQIIGYSELLIEEVQEWGHPGLVDDLQKIWSAGRRLQALTEREQLPLPSLPEPAPEASPPAEEPAPPPPLFDVDRALIKVGATIFLIWVVVRAWSVVVLLGISLMLVATLSPLVRRMEARLRRGIGVVVVAVSVVGAVAALMAIIMPPLLRQGQSLAASFPVHVAAVEGALRKWRVPLSVSSLTQGWTTQAAPQIINVASTVFSGIVELVMVAVLTLYLLIDGPTLQMNLIRLLPRSERLAMRQVLGTIAQQVGSFVRGQLLTSLLVGLFSFFLLIALRVPEPLALAAWMALADAIPLVGLPIGMVPAVLMALTRGPSTAVFVAIGYVLYHQFETTVLVPRIYGSMMKLSGTVILLSILIGGKLMGVVGALVALPVAAAVPVVVRYIGQWRDRQADRRRERG